jgi:hypothetical protein
MSQFGWNMTVCVLCELKFVVFFFFVEIIKIRQKKLTLLFVLMFAFEHQHVCTLFEY